MSWFGLTLSANGAALLIQLVFICLGVFAFVQPIHFKRRYRIACWRYKRLDAYLKTGIWATVAVFGFVIVVGGFEHCPDGVVTNCPNKFQLLLQAPPNEVGDTLAGFAGTLAFLWIIVTVMLQSKELAAQRQELSLSRKESAKMASALKDQADIFKDEKKQRAEIAAKEVFENLLLRLGRSLDVLAELKVFWSWEEADGSFSHNLVAWRQEDQEERIREFCHSLDGAWRFFVQEENEKEFNKKPSIHGIFEYLIRELKSIEEVVPKLSEAQQIRAIDLGLYYAADNLSDLIETSVLWEQSNAPTD